MDSVENDLSPPEVVHLYACVQIARKMHPMFDRWGMGTVVTATITTYSFVEFWLEFCEVMPMQ